MMQRDMEALMTSLVSMGIIVMDEDDAGEQKVPANDNEPQILR